MDIEDYSPLDLSIFVEQSCIAVKCESEEEAIHFLAAMKAQYPDKCLHWNFPEVHWERGVCYCAGVHHADKWERMMRGDEVSWKKNHYTIIPFESLLMESIEESDQPLSLLFEGVRF